jgi:hypothetical protein
MSRLAAEVALPRIVLPRRPVAGLTAGDIDELARGLR